MNVNIKNLNLSVIMPAITKSGQPVCNDREPSKDDKVEHASGLYLIYEALYGSTIFTSPAPVTIGAIA